MEILESRIALSEYAYVEALEPHAELVLLPSAINGNAFSLVDGNLTI
jgi:hypothetical protein